jgi:hypothetical protein
MLAMQTATNYNPARQGSDAGFLFARLRSLSKRPSSVGSNPGATLAGTQAEFTVKDFCFMPFAAASPEEYKARFWSKVKKSKGCWLWQAGTQNGYGFFCTRTNKIETHHYAHRYAYEITNGPIPAGKTLDHLCHNRDEACAGGPACRHRKCVRPDHLEPASNVENVMRGKSPAAICARRKHCAKGHEYTPENTKMQSRTRLCITCQRNQVRRRPPLTDQQRKKKRIQMRAKRAAQRSSQ